MASPQTASYQGRDFTRLRPGSYAEAADLLELWEDLACLYEQLTGQKVPNSTAIAATPHIHDGTDGALIRTPLASQMSPTQLLPRSASWAGSNTPSYQPVHIPPFFAPAGVSEVEVLVFVDRADFAWPLRAAIYDATAGTLVSEPEDGPQPVDPDHWMAANYDVTVMRWRLACNPGVKNHLRLEAWDGFTFPGTDAVEGAQLPLQSWIYGWSVVPLDGPPAANVYEAEDLVINGTDYAVPSDFLALDAHMFGNDRSISSVKLSYAAKILALIYEVLVGRAAGTQAQASKTHNGHKHVGDPATSMDDAGAEIDAPLGSWSYGTVREAMFVHTADGSSNEWRGHCVAPTLTNTTTSYEKVTEHVVRLPAATNANLGVTGATTKLKVGALLYKPNADSVDVRATMRNTSAGAAGTAKVVNSTGSGLVAVTIANVEAPTDATGGETEAVLSIELRDNTGKNGNVALLGVCCWYEA